MPLNKSMCLMRAKGIRVTLYRVLQYHLEEFIRYFKWVLVSRDEFDRCLRVEPDTLTDIQRSARFYYLQKLCFGGRMVDPAFGTATTRPRCARCSLGSTFGQ